MGEVRQDVVDAKNYFDRKFHHLTENFYILKASLRYFSVKKGMSFTSSKVSDNFPVTVPVAGSCLSVLEELDVVESRNSSKPKRYMPQDVDMDRLTEIEEVLRESKEIQSFKN